MLNNSQNVYNYLSKLDFSKITIFPVIFNGSLFGFLILNIDTNFKDRIQMYRSYLESTSKPLSWNIEILNPLNRFQLKSCLSGFDLIKDPEQRETVPSQNDSKQKMHLIDHPTATHNNINSNLINALNYIDNNINSSLTLEDVAQKVFLSPSYLSRLFKKHFNVNFVDYINTLKIAIAQREIALTNTPINKLSRHLGFSQTSYFTKIFKQKCNVTPSKYRKQNKHLVKFYTISRDLSWLKDQSAYEISKRYFADKGIEFQAYSFDGYPFIYQIGDLNSQEESGGWIYTVNCQQPTTSPNKISVGDKSVIQWIYIDFEF